LGSVPIETRRIVKRLGWSAGTLSTASGSIEAVWIRRRPQGVDEERKGVELFVTISPNRGSVRLWKFVELWATHRDKSVEVRASVDSVVQRRLPHHIRNGPVKLQTRVIQIFPILHADKIRRLNRIKRTRAMPGNHTRGITS